MKIVFWNKKGGVGKTALAYNVARDLELFLLSNDDSIIEMAYPGKAKIVRELPVIDNAVYDLGGFADAAAKQAIAAADLVVIPTTADLNAVKRTASTISDVQHVAPEANILIVANRAKGEDFAELEKRFSDLTVIEIPESRIFERAIKNQTSVLGIGESSKFNAYTYRKVLGAYKNLLNIIRKETK
jgi:cellulose biosynthesis protein BcsQ